ncbi:hypothetical protein A2U01_0003821, partial [Trifolium medium]|nr:hypothetical protein [Trifolium medium]
MPGSAGVGFTPHVVHVAIGEDISAKVIALSQVHARALCVLSGFGSVSAVTLGSLLPTENGSIRDRAGGISVMLSSPEGRVFGGRVAGQLIASAPTK